jgi:hypothetical protein
LNPLKGVSALIPQFSANERGIITPANPQSKAVHKLSGAFISGRAGATLDHPRCRRKTIRFCLAIL